MAAPQTTQDNPGLYALPETRAYHDLVHTHSCVTTKSADLYREHGLTEQQFHVLHVLMRGGPGGLPCLEVARQLPTPAPDITRLIERMRRAGFVTRQRLERDRRVVMIELSPRGRQVLERVLPRAAAFHRERLANLSTNELDLLTRLLRKARGES